MQKETGRIIYYLNCLESEQDSLENRPYVIFEDMAVVFGFLDEDRLGIYKIDNDAMADRGWDLNYLVEEAKRNTSRLLPARIEPASKRIIGHTKDDPVFLLSNDVCRYGSGVICYKNLLYDFAHKYNHNLYLLPTSIHEFMILLDQGRHQQENLQKIVKESNRSLKEDEILSDNIYYYDRGKRELFGLF